MFRRLAPLLLIALPAAAPAQPAEPAGPAEEAKPVTKADLTADLDADYADLDTNADGKVDNGEIVARLDRTARAQLAQIVKERDAAFARADTNGDGSISKAEFDAQAKLPTLPEPDAKPFLAQFDADKDGTISRDEFRAPTLANFDRMDGDKNGTLSVAEQQLAARVRAKPQSTPTEGR